MQKADTRNQKGAEGAQRLRKHQKKGGKQGGKGPADEKKRSGGGNFGVKAKDVEITESKEDLICEGIWHVITAANMLGGRQVNPERQSAAMDYLFNEEKMVGVALKSEALRVLQNAKAFEKPEAEKRSLQLRLIELVNKHVQMVKNEEKYKSLFKVVAVLNQIPKKSGSSVVHAPSEIEAAAVSETVASLVARDQETKIERLELGSGVSAVAVEEPEMKENLKKHQLVLVPFDSLPESAAYTALSLLQVKMVALTDPNASRLSSEALLRASAKLRNCLSVWNFDSNVADEHTYLAMTEDVLRLVREEEARTGGLLERSERLEAAERGKNFVETVKPVLTARQFLDRDLEAASKKHFGCLGMAGYDMPRPHQWRPFYLVKPVDKYKLRGTPMAGLQVDVAELKKRLSASLKVFMEIGHNGMISTGLKAQAEQVIDGLNEELFDVDYSLASTLRSAVAGQHLVSVAPAAFNALGWLVALGVSRGFRGFAEVLREFFHRGGPTPGTFSYVLDFLDAGNIGKIVTPEGKIGFWFGVYKTEGRVRDVATSMPVERPNALTWRSTMASARRAVTRGFVSVVGAVKITQGQDEVLGYYGVLDEAFNSGTAGIVLDTGVDSGLTTRPKSKFAGWFEPPNTSLDIGLVGVGISGKVKGVLTELNGQVKTGDMGGEVVHSLGAMLHKRGGSTIRAIIHAVVGSDTSAADAKVDAYEAKVGLQQMQRSSNFVEQMLFERTVKAKQEAEVAAESHKAALWASTSKRNRQTLLSRALGKVAVRVYFTRGKDGGSVDILHNNLIMQGDEEFLEDSHQHDVEFLSDWKQKGENEPAGHLVWNVGAAIISSNPSFLSDLAAANTAESMLVIAKTPITGFLTKSTWGRIEACRTAPGTKDILQSALLTTIQQFASANLPSARPADFRM